MTAGPHLDPTGPSPLSPNDAAMPDAPTTTALRRVLRFGVQVAVILCWAGVALVAVALATTMAGVTLTPLHAVFQMALPCVVIALSVPVLFAACTRRRALAVASGILLIGTVVLVVPAALPADAPPSSPDDLGVFVANVRYNNERILPKAEQVLERDEDALVVLELTPAFLDLLDAGGIGATHPYRLAVPLWGAHGAGIFSKRPIRDARTEPIGNLNAPAATVDTPTGPIRVVAIHTHPPVTDEYVPVWEEDLAAIRDFAAHLTVPTVLAGDFNAARWHPDYDDILDLGLRDAHEEMGKGLSFSWPVDGRLGMVLPPFSRLDHALLFDADATAVDDLPAVGSDHTAFSVRVRAAPADTVEP